MAENIVIVSNCPEVTKGTAGMKTQVCGTPVTVSSMRGAQDSAGVKIIARDVK